jgi:uncharacterized protein (DUF58 family)
MRRPVGLLVGTAVLLAAAGARASLALFALAVGRLVMLVAAGASVLLAVHRLTVTRSILQREAREDQPIGVRFQVRGLGRLPLPVHLEARADVNRWVPLDERGGTLQLTVGRRGRWQLAPSRLRLRDSLGIFEWPLLAGQPEPLLILPVPDPTVHIPQRLGASIGDPEPDGLQPYVPGSPIGRIYWPALARGAGLQQRRLAAAPTGLPLVVVDTAGASDPRAVDWAARAAAGVIVRLARSGGCRVLLPGDPTATTVTDAAATWRDMHRRLAELDATRPGAARATPGAGREPDVHIRADRAPAEVLVEQPRSLPAGVVAVASPRRAGP